MDKQRMYNTLDRVKWFLEGQAYSLKFSNEIKVNRDKLNDLIQEIKDDMKEIEEKGEQDNDYTNYERNL